MGRISHERLIKVTYDKNTVEYWKMQSPEFQALCDFVGKPFGYSGMNVFVFFLFMYCLRLKGGLRYTAWWKKGEEKPMPQG